MGLAGNQYQEGTRLHHGKYNPWYSCHCSNGGYVLLALNSLVQANDQGIYSYPWLSDWKCDHLQLPYCIWMLLQPRRMILLQLLEFLECEINGWSSWSTRWERPLPKRLVLWVSPRCSLQLSTLPASCDMAG